MFRIHTNPSNRSTPPTHCEPMSQPVENEKIENNKMGRLPVAVIAGTYKYFLEGIRILGEGYSSYDDRNPQ
jgi:hypothetical protein